MKAIRASDRVEVEIIDNPHQKGTEFTIWKDGSFKVFFVGIQRSSEKSLWTYWSIPRYENTQNLS